MDQSQAVKIQWSQWIRKPTFILGAVAAIAVAANAALLAAYTVPSFRVKESRQDEVRTKQQQVQRLSEKTKPAERTDSQIEDLLRKAPTRLYTADAYLSIDAKLADIKARVTYFAESADAGAAASSAKDDRTELQDMGMPDGDSNADGTASSGTGSSSAGSTSGADARSPFRSTRYQLRLIGTFDGLINFMRRVSEDKQVVYINDWKIAKRDNSKSAAAAGGEASDDDDEDLPDILKNESVLYTMDIVLEFFSMPQYFKAFGGIERNPTSFQRMMNGVNSNYPDIEPFRSNEDSALAALEGEK